MWLHYDYRMITRIAAQTDNRQYLLSKLNMCDFIFVLSQSSYVYAFINMHESSGCLHRIGSILMRRSML